MSLGYDPFDADGIYDDDMMDVGFTRRDFARPGSALRAATPSNPRNRPCPSCNAPDVLTPRDEQLGYQCDACADAAEGVGGF